MSEIIFIFKGKEVPIQCSKREKLKKIIQRLIVKLNVSKEDIYLLYGGKILDEELTEDKILKDENNKRKILVYEIDKSTKINNIIKSNEVICPICKEICLIKIKDYKIILYNCINKHINEILINEYDETQKINLSKIVCNECNRNNKGNTYNNEFYKCINCNINICPICKSYHNNNHVIIEYDKRNIICNIHNESYFGYCNECNKNICTNCEDEHNNHNIITYGKIIKDKNKIIENNNKLRKNIDIFNDVVKEIINKLIMIMYYIEKYYEINKNIINNINNKNKNYDIHNDIKNIINEKDINIQFQKIFNIYKLINEKDNKEISNQIMISNEIKNNDNKDEITIKYKVNKDDKEIKIFGETFVKNNKDKCKYIYEGKENELNEHFDLSNYNKSKDILEIKLIGLKNVTDMSHLFDDCKSLIEVPDISHWNTSNITNMNFLFYFCQSLKSLPDISKWDTSKVTVHFITRYIKMRYF